MLPYGKKIRARVLVRNFGARLGMLVVSDDSEIWSARDEIVAQGYGFSVMSDSEPNDEYDRDGYIELRADWTWTGFAAERPK